MFDTHPFYSRLEVARSIEMEGKIWKISYSISFLTENMHEIFIERYAGQTMNVVRFIDGDSMVSIFESKEKRAKQNKQNITLAYPIPVNLWISKRFAIRRAIQKKEYTTNHSIEMMFTSSSIQCANLPRFVTRWIWISVSGCDGKFRRSFFNLSGTLMHCNMPCWTWKISKN